MVGGDFNAFLKDEEKNGGRTIEWDPWQGLINGLMTVVCLI